MDLIQLLRDELRRSLHGPAWHGSALLEVLEDVSIYEAKVRAIGKIHTVAEITLHCLAWIEEVTRRMTEGIPVLPARGDWPPIPSPFDENAWASLRADITHAGEHLDREIAAFDPDRLREEIGGLEYDPPLGSGSGVSYVMMLHGLAQHHAYHGGQIALLKRGLRSSVRQ